MSDIHVTRELLRAVARGGMPVRVLTEVGWQHLLALCPYCRAELEAWQREQRSGANYDSAFQALPVLLEQRSKDLAAQEATAVRDLRELLALPQAQRLDRIERARIRFRGLTLARLLLEEAKRHIPAEPQAVYDLAEVAYRVISRSPQSMGTFDFFARAVAYMGNAARAQGRLKDAELRIAGARSFIRQGGVTDPLVYAEVDWFEGILRKDQRRFRQAEELLYRSAGFYDLAGELIEAARSLLSLGAMYYHNQSLARAVEVTEAALRNLTAETEPRLYLSARHNLALYLCEAGRHSAAEEAVLCDQELYAQFPDLFTKLRLIWLQGKIASGLGRPEEAERALTEARHGFMLQGIGYDAAMVSLDLALVYIRQGRAGEVKTLAEEMHEIFAAGDVHREAVAALLLFEEAARQEALTVEAVEEFAGYLRKARSNPSLRFRRRSS